MERMQVLLSEGSIEDAALRMMAVGRSGASVGAFCFGPDGRRNAPPWNPKDVIGGDGNCGRPYVPYQSSYMYMYIYSQLICIIPVLPTLSVHPPMDARRVQVPWA